jgi:hypothetical protein
MMTLAAMQRMKMPIWNFQRHLAGLSLYPAPSRMPKLPCRSHPLSVSFSTGEMSEIGQKPILADVRGKSALPLTADIPNPTLCEYSSGYPFHLEQVAIFSSKGER